MRAILKYIVSSLICAALIIGPSAMAVIVLGFVGGRLGLVEVIPSNVMVWLLGGVLMVGAVISSVFVSRPMTFRECLKNEGVV